MKPQVTASVSGGLTRWFEGPPVGVEPTTPALQERCSGH